MSQSRSKNGTPTVAKNGSADDKNQHASKKRVITEDDLYRNSTQFRLWSFTDDQLAEKRARVNAIGKQKALKKLKLFCEDPSNPHKYDELKSILQPVSEEEEMKEISYYVGVLQKLSTAVLKLPSQVRATAVAFLKRFYLIHSVMEYHPKKVLSTCLFLAAKSENCFMSPKTLAEFIGSKTTPESILELEFELIHALSFTLLCHHPFRPLHGFFFDFQSVLIHKHPKGVVVLRKDEKTGEKKKLRVKFPVDRIMKGYVAAREYSDHSLISDAAFLYTPPQIALACFLKADEEMTIAYLTYKFVKDQKSTKKKKAGGGKEDHEEGEGDGDDSEDGDDEDGEKDKEKETNIKQEDRVDETGNVPSETSIKQESLALEGQIPNLSSGATVKEDEKNENENNETEKKNEKDENGNNETEKKDTEKLHNIAFYKKLMKMLRGCLKVIESVHNPTLDEAKTIDKKVHYCINPDKLLKRKRQESPESAAAAGRDAKRAKTQQ